MLVPIEIANKVLEYQNLGKEELLEDIMNWLKENSNAEDVYIGEIFIAGSPTGQKQSKDGEYCDQHQFGDTGDSFYGTYYHKIENSEKYVAYRYEC